MDADMGTHPYPDFQIAGRDMFALPFLAKRAAELVRQADAFTALPLQERIDAALSGAFSPSEWMGSATEILREVARGA